ncbi:MAG: NADH-quinone oxidoreductase subunit L [Bdellovibrionales bacterium]|nr:NADH-quinone oxidoreductase subunit L [Bdellovibrionales bacterium]
MASSKAEFLFAILILAPLLGFLANGLRWKSKNYMLAGSIATAAAGTSFIAALAIVMRLFGEGAPKAVTADFFQWISIAGLEVPVSFVIDHISALMVLVVTGVGTLIHLFSIGYMSHDERPTKYFAYLNLFLFNMLLLILGENLVLMFVGWEGVGLCSYLLIGFWFTDKEKAAAGMKAFVTNRIGDAGFLLGMFMLFVTFGSLGFSEIISKVAGLAAETGWTGPITLAALFLFVGATGKSAQIPLYVWLPDAMAGPTPVSALIHAATMVTAGVYMIVRLSPLFILAPNAMMVIAIIGAATAVLAATIGLTQFDIKKVLAYSTVSQLGYMFLACGVGAFGAAMFHLVTHAFFKALMFLGSGSVIHGMHEEQDIRKMGGLAKYMPLTYLTFFVGWIAIIGLPPFAGFFSKDEILWFAFSSPHGSVWLWLAGFVGAACTAFYMTRLMALTFWGKPRFDEHHTHPHEAGPSMTIPLVVLAILSAVGGFMGIPHVIGEILPGHPGNWLEHWLHGFIAVPAGETHGSAVMEWILMGLSVSIAGLSAITAYFFYVKEPSVVERVKNRMGRLHTLVYNKYFVDEIYFAKIIDPIVNGSKALWAFVDVNFIDRATFVAGDLVKGIGSTARTLQSGNLQQYALFIALGVVGFLAFLFELRASLGKLLMQAFGG